MRLQKLRIIELVYWPLIEKNDFYRQLEKLCYEFLYLQHVKSIWIFKGVESNWKLGFF